MYSLTIKELTYLLQNPSLLKEEQTYALEKISAEFPYFQSIRSILLKSLKDQESFRYNQELKTTAAYTTDRSVLFNYITSPLFKKHPLSPAPEKKEHTDITVIDSEEVKALVRIPIDDAVSMNIKEAEEVLDPSLFSSKEESIHEQIKISTPPITEEAHPLVSEEKSLEKPLEIDKPLDFSKKETHSFAEWLKLTSIQPINNKTVNNDSIEGKEESQHHTKDSLPQQKQQFDIIDDFITKNPKIKPADKNAPSRNLANEHIVTPDELMTETLARVYLAQKKYKKAIQAYKILILKNPEKSGFFADQIRAIQKIHENK